MIENENPREFGQKVNVISLLILASMLKMGCKKETKKTQESLPKDDGKNPGQQTITYFRKLIKQVMKGDRLKRERMRGQRQKEEWYQQGGKMYIPVYSLQ